MAGKDFLLPPETTLQMSAANLDVFKTLFSKEKSSDSLVDRGMLNLKEPGDINRVKALMNFFDI